MKFDHELAQDLLPLYAEGLLREGNRTRMDEHIAECEQCQAALGTMRRSEVKVETHPTDAGLKGVRQKLRRNNAIVAAATAFVCVFIGLLIWSCFMLGSDALGFAFIAFFVIMPIAAFVCALIAGRREHKFKWFLPLIFGVLAFALPQIIFSYTDSTFFTFAFFPALVGVVIGHVSRLLKKRKERKEK